MSSSSSLLSLLSKFDGGFSAMSDTAPLRRSPVDDFAVAIAVVAMAMSQVIHWLAPGNSIVLLHAAVTDQGGMP